MGIKLRDFFNSDKEVDFSKVSFFDELVEHLIDTTEKSNEFVIEFREEYIENKISLKNKNTKFLWTEIPSSVNSFEVIGTHLAA